MNASNDLLPCVEIDSTFSADPPCSVIWLHGLGADGHDFEPIIPELGLNEARGCPVRFVFPHASVRPVTLNGGMAMRAWYDIKSLDGDRDEDLAGIEESVSQVIALIERERSRGVDSRQIIVAGFSQGGAIAGVVGLRYPEPLAGVVMLSTYRLLADRMASEVSDANRQTPHFCAHGQFDPVVPLAWGEENRTALEELGHPVTWGVYPTAHSVERTEIDRLGEWMRDRFQLTGQGA